MAITTFMNHNAKDIRLVNGAHFYPIIMHMLLISVHSGTVISITKILQIKRNMN